MATATDYFHSLLTLPFMNTHCGHPPQALRVVFVLSLSFNHSAKYKNAGLVRSEFTAKAFSVYKTGQIC